MKHTRMPESKCTLCGYKLDAASSVEGEHSPTPGDISICIGCAEILIFNEIMVLEKVIGFIARQR